MFTSPDRLSQLAGEHHLKLLAEASQRQLRHQAAEEPGLAARITRRLLAAIARVSVAARPAPGAIWPAGTDPLGEPVGHARSPGRGH